MDADLLDLIWRRAQRCCEYCWFPQAYSHLSFEIDHILAKKHGGLTRANNTALTCFYCNSFKGSNIAGVDNKTNKIVKLYHPRRHQWAWHFRWQGPILVGRTPIGRATIAVLRMNEPEAVAMRAALIAAGLFPPNTLPN